MGPEDEEYDDDAVEYEDDGEYVDEELEELVKPEPIKWPDAYSAAPYKPVELEVPGHSDAFKVIGEAKEQRFPAKQVAKSAAELAKVLRAAAQNTKQ